MKRARRAALLTAPVLAALLLAAPALADGVRILGSDREAAEARVEMVLAARQELLASAFIFGDDPFTLTSLALLRGAARHGVQVRLIADAQWNHVPRAVQAHLLAEGIEIREYHPFRLDRLSWLSRRMHDKLAVADGRVLLAGGRNLESTYFGFGRQIGAHDYVDCDLEVEGDAAAEARRYFLALWESRHVRPSRPRATPTEISKAAALLDRHLGWLEARIDEARHDPARPPRQLTESGPVRFLHDPIGDAAGERKVGAELRDLLAAARQSVVIESPYLVPTRALRQGLRQALARGVSVRILTNSLQATDNLWPQAGYAGEKADLVRGGVELWEYQGPECLHAKDAVIDGETVIVGSYNLDPRSQSLNRELALVVTNRALADDLRRRMDAHLANAVRIDARGYPQGADEAYPGVPRRKVWKLRLLRLLAPLVRGQL
ncbi:MAG TPA: phosphatidylserine/phosphatidylglycerophosphate/cardiolipin synthase family protein [Thermoanaerobaculia bacterium]|jgi:putative cardiolipin synthase|nr:phosphatidylserine/phosphatidylglycerophosphate/cardiolipin synthase family protein [Thermoanaerobaculia bacterium]